MKRALALVFGAFGASITTIACAPPRLVAPLRYEEPPVVADEPFRAHEPVLAPVVEASDPPPHETVLPNGLRVVVVERHGFPVVESLLYVDRGAVDLGDPAGNALAQATILFSRGGDEGAFERRSTRLAAAAASLTTGASPDAVWASVKAPSPSLDEALALLAENTFAEKLSPQEYDRRLSELVQSTRGSRYSVRFAERRVLFGQEHAYGYVRPGRRPIPFAEATALHDRLFQPNQATLIVVGDVAPDQVTLGATRAFGAWSATSLLPKQTGPAPAFEGAGAPVSVVSFRQLAQTHASVFARGPDARSDDAYAFAVAAQLLGGANSSKVWTHLRDEGAAYTINAPVAGGRAATWLSLDASYDPDKAVDGVKERLAAIERLRAGTPTEEEVAIARETVLSQWRTGMATVEGAAMAYASQINLSRGFERANDYPMRIARVRKDGLIRVANKYLRTPALHVVFLGDDRAIDPTPLGMGDGTVLRLN